VEGDDEQFRTGINRTDFERVKIDE